GDFLSTPVNGHSQDRRHVSKVPILLQKSVETDGCWPVVSLTAIGFVRRLPGALYATLTLRNTRRMSGWRSRNQRREPPQVLGDGSKDNLVLGTSRSKQSKPTELQDALYVRETHRALL